MGFTYERLCSLRACKHSYEDFLAAGKAELSAGEREQWAAQHTGDPEEPRALVDAGWRMARSRQIDEALELFRRAAEFGGEFGRDAQVGIVDQLYALEQGREAEVRRALTARPGPMRTHRRIGTDC